MSGGGVTPESKRGDCWLCQHPVTAVACPSCGCLAHYPPHPRVEMCTHCGDTVTNPPPGDWWTHAKRGPDGTLHAGKSRCQSPDVAYGHLAHPADVPCRADEPNPCLGATARCPQDGQTRAYHLAIGGTHSDDSPRTNGEFIGCDFGAPAHPGSTSTRPADSGAGEGM